MESHQKVSLITGPILPLHGLESRMVRVPRDEDILTASALTSKLENVLENPCECKMFGICWAHINDK